MATGKDSFNQLSGSRKENARQTRAGQSKHRVVAETSRAQLQGAPDDGDLCNAYRQAKIIRLTDDPVYSVSFSCMTNFVATVGGGSIHVFDFDKKHGGAPVRSLGSDEPDEDDMVCMGSLHDVDFSKNIPRILAAASADTCVYIWNYSRSKIVKRLCGHTGEVNGVCFHPSQHMICSTSDDATAMIWDAHEGKNLRCLAAHSNAAYGAAFLGAAFQHNVATCSCDQQVRVFDMRDKTVVVTLQDHQDEVVGLDFSVEMQCLASGSDDGFICLWDVRKFGQPLFKIDTRGDLNVPSNQVKRVAFNASGTKLACGTSSKQVLVYTTEGTSPEIYGLCSGRVPHTDTVFDVCFCYNAKGQEYLVDASFDQTTSVWFPTKLPPDRVISI